MNLAHGRRNNEMGIPNSHERSQLNYTDNDDGHVDALTFFALKVQRNYKKVLLLYDDIYINYVY